MMQKFRMIEGSVRPGGGAGTGLTTDSSDNAAELGRPSFHAALLSPAGYEFGLAQAPLVA
jgi:hypothetical protein